MKLGFNEATCMKKSSLERDLALCEKYGYDYIEIRLDMLRDYYKKHTINDLVFFFKNNNIKPFALNSIEDINFCTPKQWEDRIDLIKFACETAQAIDNPYLVVVPTRYDELNCKTEQEVLDDSVEVLSKMSEISKQYNVKLAFEPIGDKHWCCNSMRQAYEIVESVDSDYVGLVIDSFNIYLHDKCADIEYINNIPLEKIFVYHINDSEDFPLGILDHCHRNFPGEGVIPLLRFKEILQEKGYKESASLELFRPQYWEWDPEEVIKVGKERCLKFI